eukprot:7390543-Pyramimonas_sp.AAC.1
MLLSLLQGNLPRVELVVLMTTSDYHRLEPDVADNKVEKHFHHRQQGDCCTTATTRLVTIRYTNQSTKFAKP